MFSVGATPFNSPARARYGGWAATAAQVTGDGTVDFDNYMALKMAADYNTNADPAERTAARQLSKDIWATYKALKDTNPNNPHYIEWKIRKNQWRGPFVRTPMPDAMRQGIWTQFRRLDNQPTWANRRSLQILRQAPYRVQPTIAQLAPYRLQDLGLGSHWEISQGIGKTKGRIYSGVPEFNLPDNVMVEGAPAYAANVANPVIPAMGQAVAAPVLVNQ